MRHLTNAAVRICSMMLAFVIMLTAFPASAFSAIDEPLTGTTGNGWDDFGGPHGGFDINAPPVIPDFPDDDDLDSKDRGSGDLTAPETEEEGAVVTMAEDSGLIDTFIQDYQKVALDDWANSRLRSGGSPSVSTIYWPNGDTPVGRITYANGAYINSPLPKISFNSEAAFCYEWNGQSPSGMYSLIGPGTNSAVKKYLANYFSGSQSDARYVATQALIWALIMGTSVTSWGSSGVTASHVSSITSGGSGDGVEYEVYGGGSQNIIVRASTTSIDWKLKVLKKSTSGRLLSGAAFSVSGPGVNQTGLVTNNRGEILVDIPSPGGTYTVTETGPPSGYLPANPASQTVTVNLANPIGTVTFENEPEDDEPPPEEDCPSFRVEVEVEVDTRVENYNSADFEYSRAYGQLTVRKQDQDGKALDGALFTIEVRFSDGTVLRETGWEVDNGARLFSYSHPENNHDAAAITVWETKAPQHYTADPTPKTVTVMPSYVRTVITTQWSQMFWTYFYRYTVIEISHDSDETEVDSWTDSRDEFEVTSPIIQSYPEHVPGDREITTTFVNVRERGQLIVTKRDANTGQTLAGADIHVKGVDLGNAGTYDMILTTGANGEAVFNGLFPGSYSVQEIRPPYGYNINSQVQAVTIQSNETVRREVHNTRQAGLFIKKVDENGKPLSGATFELRTGAGQALHREVTDANGIIWRGYLPTGYYEVEEIKAPEGYIMDANNPQTIYIDNTEYNKEFTLTFINLRKPAIEIIKVDGTMPTLRLEGAVFRITNVHTIQYWDIQTGRNGTALLEDLEIESTYVVEEITAPEGYVNGGFHQEIILREARTHTITVSNEQKPSLKFIKKDTATGVLLEGAVFRLAKEGSASFRDVTTGKNGVALFTGLDPGTYIVTEVKAPNGYLPIEEPITVIIKEGEHIIIEIPNHKQPSLTIIKKDKATGRALSGATFRVSWNSGADFRDVTTEGNGEAVVTGLNAGWYTITELRPPEGYLLNAEPIQILLSPGEDAAVEFFNEPKPSLTLLKVDNVTKTPLQFARFKIELKTETGTTLIGEYVSDEDGVVFLDNILPGRYLITEIEAPPGYNIDREIHEITIEYGQVYRLEITNTPKSPIYIQKVDDQGNPLMGAQFRVTTMNGAMVGTVTSGHTGYAIIPYAEPGWYVVTEVKSPEGYILSSVPQNVQVLSGRPAQVEFVNLKKPELTILKLDESDKSALMGARFRIAKTNGEIIGTFTSDRNGLVILKDLDAGSYVISEIASPDGYILNATPQIIELKPGESKQIEMYNTAKPGLQLRKVDKLTNLPVGGARFSLVRLDKSGNYNMVTYTTGDNGLFFVPDLIPGQYILTETMAPAGYILNPAPQNIYIEGGKLNTVEIFNIPYSSLRIVKISADDERKPLAGAVFKLFDELRLEIGIYETSALGEIMIPQLPAGTYYIQETRAPAGYILDSTVRKVELTGGKTTVVEVKNRELGSLRILKRNKDDGKPLYNATFLFYDSKNNLLGEYSTDQNGLIVFGKNLAAGIYKLKESKAPDGFVLDDTIRTVTVKEGETTEIMIDNEPVRGKIQITKKASEYNDITKHKEGALLSGAVFEIIDKKNSVVDRIETDGRGVATSKNLPVGVYAIREITAPKHYLLDDQVFYAEIKVHGDLVQFEVLNKPVDISVTVQKYGNYEAMPGDVIRYDFKNIANTSTVSLNDFYFHDAIPTDALRLMKIQTGTWNEKLTYKVMYKTNLHDYRVLADKLHTEVNNELDYRREALHLKNGEYITDIKFEFGTVQPGFMEVTPPAIFCAVNGDLPNEYRFVNRADAGGWHEGEFTIAKDTWVTIIYSGKGKGKLPKTGF